MTWVRATAPPRNACLDSGLGNGEPVLIIQEILTLSSLLSCTERNQGLTVPANVLKVGLRISSWYLTAVRVLWSLLREASPHHRWPLTQIWAQISEGYQNKPWCTEGSQEPSGLKWKKTWPSKQTYKLGKLVPVRKINSSQWLLWAELQGSLDKEREMTCGHHLQNHCFKRCCLANCFSFPPAVCPNWTTAGETESWSESLSLPSWKGWQPGWIYTLTILCSLIIYKY